MKLLDGDFGGFAVDRLTHSLQTATRAHRDGRDEDYVVMALLHDIGDTLGAANHPDIVTPPVAMGAGRGLKRMGQPVHRKAAKIAVEQLQMVQYPLSAILGEGDIVPHDDLPIFLRAQRHVVKSGAIVLIIHVTLPLLSHAIMPFV